MTENEYASPACAIAQAGDVYLGYAARDELVAALARLLVTVAEPWRPMLAAHLTALHGAAPAEVAPLIGGEPADLLRGLLPRVRDDRLHADLSALLKSYKAG